MQFVRILNDMNMKRMSSVITIPMKYGVEFCELVMMMFSISKQTTTRNAMMARGLSAHDMMWEEREKKRKIMLITQFNVCILRKEREEIAIVLENCYRSLMLFPLDSSELKPRAHTRSYTFIFPTSLSHLLRLFMP